MFPHRARRHPGIRPGRSEVDLFSVREPGHVEKTAEVPDGAGETLGPNLFSEIRSDVGFEVFPGFWRIEDGRNTSSVQSVEEPLVIQLSGDERMERAHSGPAAEKIGGPALQLSGAATGQ